MFFANFLSITNYLKGMFYFRAGQLRADERTIRCAHKSSESRIRVVNLLKEMFEMAKGTRADCPQARAKLGFICSGSQKEDNTF